MSVILRVREFKSRRTIDDTDVQFTVTFRGGLLTMQTFNHVYHHDRPAMVVEFGLVDDRGHFNPVCVNGRFHQRIETDTDFTIHNLTYAVPMELTEYPDAKRGWWK